MNGFLQMGPYVDCFICRKRVWEWEIHSHTQDQYREYYERCDRDPNFLKEIKESFSPKFTTA
jgi:hypothetical protein